MSTRLMTFVAAVIYGVAWVAGPLNLLAAILIASEGGNPLGSLSTILMCFGIIAFVHHREGWFPFHRRPDH